MTSKVHPPAKGCATSPRRLEARPTSQVPSRGKPDNIQVALLWFAEACFEAGRLERNECPTAIGRARQAHCLAYEAATFLLEAAGEPASEEQLEAATAFCQRTVSRLANKRKEK